MRPSVPLVDRQREQERFGRRRILEPGKRGRQLRHMRFAGLKQQTPLPVLNIGFRVENKDGPEVFQKSRFEIPFTAIISAELHL